MLVPFRLFSLSVLCSADSLSLTVSISYSVPQLLRGLIVSLESLSRQPVIPWRRKPLRGVLRVHSRLRSVTLSRPVETLPRRSSRRCGSFRIARTRRALSDVALPGQLSRFAYTVSRFVHANVIDVPASWLGYSLDHCTTVRSPVARTRVLSSRARRSMPDRPDLAAGVFRSSFVRAKEEKEHRLRDETVSKAANTDREGGSRVLVAWLAHRAALPRDTLLKQGTTLKFSEETQCGVLWK